LAKKKRTEQILRDTIRKTVRMTFTKWGGRMKETERLHLTERGCGQLPPSKRKKKAAKVITTGGKKGVREQIMPVIKNRRTRGKRKRVSVPFDKGGGKGETS